MMIIRNNFSNNKKDFVKESRISIRRNVDNLSKRFKNKEISLDNLKKITNIYAERQNKLDKKDNK